MSGPAKESKTSARTTASLPCLPGRLSTGWARPVHLDDLDALRDGCGRALGGHGHQRAADLLATIPLDTAVDRYGDGGVVAELEAEVAGILRFPAAVYLPSGTMAQQAVLRVHAERRGRRTVLFHPECHLRRHENQALERLHGLSAGRSGTGRGS